jgi:hypothetical protein
MDEGNGGCCKDVMVDVFVGKTNNQSDVVEAELGSDTLYWR